MFVGFSVLEKIFIYMQLQLSELKTASQKENPLSHDAKRHRSAKILIHNTGFTVIRLQTFICMHTRPE